MTLALIQNEEDKREKGDEREERREMPGGTGRAEPRVSTPETN